MKTQQMTPEPLPARDGSVTFTDSTRGEPLHGAMARFSLTANEVFINEQRRLGKDVTDLETEQDKLCRFYCRQYGGTAIRSSQNSTDH
jgi:hypothetical protein